MKPFIAVLAFMLTGIISVSAQPSLLKSYYEIKNALINGDALTASVKAGEFGKSADSLEAGPLKTKLAAGAKNIAESKNLVKQRNYFSSFSEDFYSLVKTPKFSDQPVYKIFCPMKNSIWLSNEEKIENPYYGKAMLTCGTVTEVINP